MQGKLCFHHFSDFFSFLGCIFAFDSSFAMRLSRAKLEKRLETGAHVLVKSHEWTGLISRETFEEAKGLFSGPAGGERKARRGHVVVSVRQGFEVDEAWMAVATQVIHFEDLVAYNKADDGQMSLICSLFTSKDLCFHRF